MITLDFAAWFAPARGSGFTQCLVMVDKLTRFVCFEACSVQATAEDTARIFLRRIVPLFGVPRAVISDCGPKFTAAVWKEVLGVMGSKVALAATHHPQTNGQSERGVRELARLVRTYTAAVPEEWADLLPLLEVAWNRAPNSTTKLSPHEAVFGRPFRTSLHWLR